MDYPQLNIEELKEPYAVMKTSLGDVKIQLFPELAPMTVENFVRLAQRDIMMVLFSIELLATL